MLRRGGTRTSGIWRESWQAGEAAHSMPYGLFGPPSDPSSGAYHRSVDRRRCDAVVTCGNPPATIPAILQPRCAVHAALAYRLMAGSGHVCCHVGDADHLDCGRVHHRSHARNGCGRFDAQACPTQEVAQRPVLSESGLLGVKVRFADGERHDLAKADMFIFQETTPLPHCRSRHESHSTIELGMASHPYAKALVHAHWLARTGTKSLVGLDQPRCRHIQECQLKYVAPHCLTEVPWKEPYRDHLDAPSGSWTWPR